MHRLKKIDDEISQAMSPMAEIAASVEMPLICLLSNEAEIAKHRYPGLYRIDVQIVDTTTPLTEWIAAFQAEWEHEAFKKSFTPNLKKKRIAGHTTLPKWMPLYLGKSKNVARRVLEHINLPIEKTTFALKLKARPAMASRVLRLHALEVQTANYDVIVPALETALRNRFHPLIGKQ